MIDTPSKVKIPIPPEQQYDYLTTQMRYLDGKIFESFALFIKIAIAIVGGTYFLAAQTLSSEQLTRAVHASNSLVVVVSSGCIFLIRNNLRAWLEHRERLAIDFSNIRPPVGHGWWSSEAVGCAGIMFVTLIFIGTNPLIEQRNISTCICRGYLIGVVLLNAFAFLIPRAFKRGYTP